MAAWHGRAQRGPTAAGGLGSRVVLSDLPRPDQLTVGRGSALLLLNSEPWSA